MQLILVALIIWMGKQLLPIHSLLVYFLINIFQMQTHKTNKTDRSFRPKQRDKTRVPKVCFNFNNIHNSVNMY